MLGSKTNGSIAAKPKPSDLFDPCQLAWQVKKFGGLRAQCRRTKLFDPCQLAWQVKKFGGLSAWLL